MKMAKELLELAREEKRREEEEKIRKQKEEEETYYRVERSYGYFNRTIQLPAEVNPDKVDATYKRGILKIKLRKLEENESKRIKITAG